jgi:hypothetical protein
LLGLRVRIPPGAWMFVLYSIDIMQNSQAKETSTDELQSTREYVKKSRRWRGCLPVVCCEVEDSAAGRSLVQRSPTACGVVIVCDLETSRIRRPWPALSCCTRRDGVSYFGVVKCCVTAGLWNFEFESTLKF